MIKRTIALFVFALLCLSAHSDEVYKWTDEKGKVHYGDAPADHLKQRAKKVELKATPPSEAQRAEAEARARHEKLSLETLDQEKKAELEKQAAAEPKPVEEAPPDEEAKCQQEMAAYERAAACFAPYRIGEGGLKGEAFQKCPEMKRPACYQSMRR